MNYEEFEDYEDLSPEEQKKWDLAQKKKKQKQQMMIMALLLIGSGTFYLFSYLPNQRKQAKEEIEELFNNNPTVQPAMLFTEENGKLINQLWPECEKWEDYLNTLYLPAQLNDFVKKMTKSITKKAEELVEEERERPRKLREAKIEEAKKLLEPVEEDDPKIKEELEKFIEKINQTSVDDLSTPKKAFDEFVFERRYKRKRVYWKLPARNWADRWLMRNKQSFNGVWDKAIKMNNDEEPSYFDAKSMYKISFSPSLWNNLTEEQKQLARSNGHDELILNPEVATYKFGSLIEDWEQRAKTNPTRGEYNPNQPDKLDNNALFFGAPRTGKSVMVEKVAYETDKYPLVTIQGSALTPSKIQFDLGVRLLEKFIFTISSITHDLVDDYGFDRDENGEVKYILFLDEADQTCVNSFDPPQIGSAQLTFLKECMGSDSKKEESRNLWIAATNHLNSVNIAIYQSGRLSNPLDFSWTLGIFNYYAERAGINSQFPQHWLRQKTLNAEDNKWVNKFNKIIFDKDFLPFWTKFINNEDTQKELNEEKETNEQGEEIIKQKGIQWGEFFEFFWQLYDSKQLENSDGKWEKPRKQTIEEVVEENVKLAANKIGGDIAKTVEERLRELNETARETKQEIEVGQANLASTISQSIETVTGILSEISSRIRPPTTNTWN